MTAVSAATLVTGPASPTKWLRTKRDDFAVLIDGDHEALFRPFLRNPTQREMQGVPADDHGLHAASRLDAEALRLAL